MNTIAELIATGFYAGKSKFAPGTVGTLVGIPFLLLTSAQGAGYILLLLLLSVAGTLASQVVIEATGVKDPEEVVIDEVVGYMLTFLFVPLSFKSLLLGFLIFRLLDILKPLPVNLFEKLPGAYGVMADDIAAGLMSAVVLAVLL